MVSEWRNCPRKPGNTSRTGITAREYFMVVAPRPLQGVNMDQGRHSNRHFSFLQGGPGFAGDGSVANLVFRPSGTGAAPGSRSRAEQGRNEVTLSIHVVGRGTDDLVLADHRHGLITGNRPRGGGKALETQPRSDQPLD